MSSQRHKMIVRNYGATCTAIAEKQPAAGYLRQIPGPYVQPVGPAGGPLQGSSLAGPPPAAIPAPGLFEHPLLAVGLLLAAGQKPLEPPAAPTLTGLDPDTAVLGDPDFTLHCHGSGFTEESVIMFAGQPEPIVFVSESEITTGVKPSLGWGPDTPLPVSVKNADGQQTDDMFFTFTAPADNEPAATKKAAKKKR